MTHWRNPHHSPITWADDFPSGGRKHKRMNGWWYVLIALCGIVGGFMAVVMWPETMARVVFGWL